MNKEAGGMTHQFLKSDHKEKFSEANLQLVCVPNHSINDAIAALTKYNAMGVIILE